MATKRKGSQEGPTAREKKKIKVADARSIPVQASSSNNTASVVPSDNKKSLPGAIDVERFAESRAFEMDAMHGAMQAASASASHRAWQTLPRHLRRRAASHDVRRVPVRIRGKARAEMDPKRKKTVSRSLAKRGKELRVSRTDSFRKRQADKTWLETHIWHAKRMHMENLWGYRLAITPTEKAFRPSHRASIHGAILHDASYQALIELKGLEAILSSILALCCDPQDPSPGAIRYATGCRTMQTHLYRPDKYPFEFVSPITILWKSKDVSVGNAQDSVSAGSGSKGKGKAVTEPESERTVWMWCHPEAFEPVFDSLRQATGLVLEASQKGGGPEVEVELADLRGEVNMFEIMGPKASQVIKGALSPISDDQRDELHQFWSSLSSLTSSASVSRGMVIGLKVVDPRLKFPPKNAKLAFGAGAYPTPTPSTVLAATELWSTSARQALKVPRFKKKDLDDRRTKNIVPGTPLKPTQKDDRVPVLLIQRSVEGTHNDQGVHGWTLVIPSGWSMPFFSSLTHTDTRVGGQRERQVQSFEAGTLFFPRDYPTSALYDTYSQRREQEERAAWDRKPAANRVNYEKRGVRSPWRADWEVILGLKVSEAATGLVSTQREIDPDGTAPQARPWLLRGVETADSFNDLLEVFGYGVHLLRKINAIRAKRGLESLLASSQDALLKGALVHVRLNMCTRGAPGDLAAIYALPDSEAKLCHYAVERAKGGRRDLFGDDPPSELAPSENKPPVENIIGYVTTGSFSLSRGFGFAIGAVSLVKLLDVAKQGQRLHAKSRPPPMLVKLSDRDGEVSRAAYIELL